jgi:hypothetical protein
MRSRKKIRNFPRTLFTGIRKKFFNAVFNRHKFVENCRTCFQNGGTGVAPVKSGVTPDFVRRLSLLAIRTSQRLFTSRTVSGATPETTGHRPVPPSQCRPANFCKHATFFGGKFFAREIQLATFSF